MYTLITPNADRTITGGTLEDLRYKLIEYHESNRRDPQYGDYIDQFHAVYPLDESELDDGETPEPARPLTPEILKGLAKHIWDTPAVSLTEEKGTDITRLAETLHYMLDMDTTAAEDALRTYITQIEELESRSIDEDEIAEVDADFLIGAVKSARRTGDLGLRELDLISEATREMESQEDRLRAARAERDAAIRAAVHAGARIQDVATAAGISRQAVDKIIRS
ncbi:hypothetical protein [Corynebacterium phoceense]|uniref:hypothetical protein n=1 Tax=Corynebacterium phoceense TaxID=1686286 RepID=UPI0018AB7ACD|nr:hypothetical protein [Corynebacterium phoceense]MBF9011272.1 hypothetical protein [Corynebacterium phoceense]